MVTARPSDSSWTRISAVMAMAPTGDTRTSGFLHVVVATNRFLASPLSRFVPRLTQPMIIILLSLPHEGVNSKSPWIAQLPAVVRDNRPLEPMIDNLLPVRTCLWSRPSPISAESFRNELEYARHGPVKLGFPEGAQACSNLEYYKTSSPLAHTSPSSSTSSGSRP